MTHGPKKGIFLRMPAKPRTRKNGRKPPKWLSDAQIRRLRKQRAKGVKLQTLADRHGLSISAVSRIVNNDRRVAA